METEAGEWRQIAQDGVQFAWENYNRPETWNKEFAMSPANRVDLLVKAPASEGEYKVVIRGGSPGPTLLDRLLTLVVKEDPGRKIAAPAMPFPVRAADYPTFPQFLQDIDPAQVTVRREITFATERGPLRDLTTGAAPKHTINGKQFEDGVIDQMMLLDSVEEWKLINKSQIEHPFHIHINPFQVVARFAPTEGMQDPDKPLRFAAPFRWQDTIAIPAASGGKNGYVIIRHRFDDFPGTYVFHCHILAHEDRGMMQLVRVVDKRTAQRHH